jgi:anaerobic ribonucleoside-triphosphate reductase activating protein
MKYVDTEVTFSEFPDEISLCINISQCPNFCKFCHSAYLSQDIGDPLTLESLQELLTKYDGISLVGFMGGDADPEYVNILAKYVKQHTNLKVGWYSGKDFISPSINIKWFDYIKIGPYIQERGPLNNPNTNQIMYKVEGDKLINITNKFWR